MNVIVSQPAIHRTKRCQQPRPTVVATFEQFFSLLIGNFSKLRGNRGDRVVLLVHGERLGGDKFPFFGTEQEHQPHHDCKRRLIENCLINAFEQFPPVILIGLVERLDQHLNRPSYLIAKLVGNFLLIGSTLGQQSFNGLVVRNAKESGQREEAAECS